MNGKVYKTEHKAAPHTKLSYTHKIIVPFNCMTAVHKRRSHEKKGEWQTLLRKSTRRIDDQNEIPKQTCTHIPPEHFGERIYC